MNTESIIPTKRLLIVDDDIDVAEALRHALSADGYACELASDGGSALEALAHGGFDLVISDVRMDGMSGIELLDNVRRSAMSVPVIVISGLGSTATAATALKHGAFQYLRKPCDLAELRGSVHRALTRRRARVVEQPARETHVTPIGDAMAPILETVQQVAASSCPVLILGETGTGKELVAREIHLRSARADKSFVAVNAAAIPEPLLESELFGHVRGAFTGATQARGGLFWEADGGTLLLDEIGDMPVSLQSKFLRVLQFGEVRPVGGDRPRHVDVRVVAATHHDFPKMIREGRFREDLYYRLSVVPITIPPLRERRGDIPQIAEHCLAQALARATSSPVRTISAEAMQRLVEAPWPGNVRELASTIERAVVLGKTETIRAEDLPFLPTAAAVLGEGAPSELCTLRELTTHHVARVLAYTAGNKPRAAEILGIDLSTLYRWVRRAP